MSFNNKVVIVTGASAGIGASIACAFAKEDASVVLVGRNEKNLNAVARLCGNKSLVIIANISDDKQAKIIIDRTVAKFNKIDVLVNNAGILRRGSILNGNIMEAYDEIMNTNLRAVIHLTTLAAPHIIKTNGNIVMISSVASTLISKISDLIPYSISKAGLDHFMRGAALELASSGVRVNCVNPGPVVTEIFKTGGYQDGELSWEDLKKLTALNRNGEPEEIADLVLFLASDKARGITGSCFVSDNGVLLKR